MDYGLDAEQEDYRLAVRQFATKVLAPHYQGDDKTATFRRQQALDLAAMGLTGLRIPDAYGGQDASAVIAGIATEEVGSGATGHRAPARYRSPGRRWPSMYCRW